MKRKKKQKTTPEEDECVCSLLGGLEETCCTEGDSVVLPERRR